MKFVVAVTAILTLTLTANAATKVITITGPAAEEISTLNDGQPTKNVSCFREYRAACNICSGGQEVLVCKLRVDATSATFEPQFGDSDELPGQMQ